MIKILQVVSSLNINAGMMSVVMNYYAHLDRKQLQFDFLYFAEMEESHKEKIEEMGGRTYYLGKAGFNSEYRKKLDKFFSEHKGEYRAIHCHPIWAAAMVGPSARKSGIAHVISHAHSTKYSEKPVSAIRNRLMMPLIKSSSTDYVACSSDAAKLFGKRKNVFVLRNAISVDRYIYDEEKRSAVRKELSVDDDTLLIGHVGRFSVEKNHAFMIKVFSELLKEYPKAKLLLIGDGVLRSDSEALAKELGTQADIIFTGKRYDIPELLCAMDVFWLPSLFEGVPVSVIEAQASGLPCVLSDSITRDVDFGRCEYIGLDRPSGEWISALRKDFGGDRSENSKKLLHSRYDIENETQNLFDFYMGLKG